MDGRLDSVSDDGALIIIQASEDHTSLLLGADNALPQIF
jgi:hypothetical protein